LEAEASNPTQATKIIAKISDVDIKHIEKNLQTIDKMNKNSK
jgi:hypothetical protein